MYNNELFNSKTFQDKKEVLEFRKNRFEKFNSLPLPLWKRVKLDDFELPEYREYGLDYIFNNDWKHRGLEVAEIGAALNEWGGLTELMEEDSSFGVGEKFVALAESLYNAGVLIRAGRNAKADEPLRIGFRLNENNPLVIDHNVIVAEENSKVTIIFDYSSGNNSETKFFHNGATRVYAMRGSEVNIIKIQRMNRRSHHLDSNVAFLDGDARVNWISVEIGAALSATNFVNNLEGTASQAEIKSVYLGDGESRIDLGYTMNHIGMRTMSNIEARGALKDKSRKVFRGDLHFKRGARRAKGSEEEYVLLLDPTVKSDAIPVLFCEEDDVEGNHAASAGQIDSEKLFYLMSRGFDEREAKKLIVEASFRPILDKIPNNDLRGEIEKEVHRRLVYA